MQYYSMDLREDKNERVDEDILKADKHAKEDKTSVGRIKLPPQYFHSTYHSTLSLHRTSWCPHKLCRGVNLKINTCMTGHKIGMFVHSLPRFHRIAHT